MGTHSLGTDNGNLIAWVWGAWELYPFCLSSSLLLSPFRFSFLFPSMHGNVLFENIYWELDVVGLGEVEEDGREWIESWFALRPCE